MQVYNTRSGRLERLSPRGDTPLGIYVCGVTPYDTTHVGHAFVFLTFDVFIRYVRRLGMATTYVQNVTDIDDDILRKAKEIGIPWNELAERETAKLVQDMSNLNALPPDHFVKATDHIAEMLAIIEPLVSKGFAYVSNGNVYFSVAKDPEFGQLSHIPRDQMLAIANERGNNPDDPHKRDPLDFVLWQKSAPDEPYWESPYGNGRPGWHIECSAMSTRYLGPTVDVHGGGLDLVFPHHEAEIAQSENSFDVKPFVRYWMHAGMVGYGDEKMSKSLGNLVLVSDVLENYHPDALRLYLFSNHYRSSWTYDDAAIEEWAALAQDLHEAVEFPAIGMDESVDVSTLNERFMNAMDDDLNTPEAIEAMREVAEAILEAPEEDDVRDAQETLREMADTLGLTLRD
jgi:L-cysteine:1D-myo-inositol 2-amino-2-deoxy-alpha-D-glucopyranoside ligase